MKKEIKQFVLEKRNAISPSERQARSMQIQERLFSLPEFQKAQTVLFYASFKSEAETGRAIEKALALGKRVALPVTDMENKALEIFQVSSLSSLRPGAFGILEPDPAASKPVPLDEIDLAVVPGVAFDEKGNRLGYGMGFYDRLLARFKGTSVALAFEVQMVPRVPSEEHDVRVKKIATEKRIINCRQD